MLEPLIRPGNGAARQTQRWSGVLYVISWSACVRCDEHGTVIMDSMQDGVAPTPGTAIPAAPIPPHPLRNVGAEDLHVILTEFKE